jgi:hypothetical protein
MQKFIDRKKQERVTLDTILASIVDSGKIYAGALKKHWKSLKPYINRKRLEYFLRNHGVKLAAKAVTYITKVDKKLAKGIALELILKH